jgi:DNA replication protein DnaC
MSTKPKLDIDRSREQLEALGLVHAAALLEQTLSAAVKQSTTAHGFLDQLLRSEVEERDQRRVKTSLRLSNLPNGMTLAAFDFAFQPSVERSRIETLATGAWVRAAETLLIQGPPGVGKTHLGVGLGVKAIEHGFSVQLIT